MAVIGKIRKYSGLLIVIIGVALASFVLQDLLGPSSCRRGNLDFGEIDGEKISKLDFDAKVAQQTERIKMQSGQENLSPQDDYSIMMMVWDQMEREIILSKQYKELGIAVEHEESPTASISPEELYDLFAGEFIHPYVAQSFADPQTGRVDVAQIKNILTNFDQMQDDQKAQWKELEEAVKKQRIAEKYNTLIAKGYYVPKAFAKRMYEESGRMAQVRMVGVKYQTIDDKTIALTDEDYQKYYDEHSFEYKTDAACDIDYIIWDVVPSEADRKKVEDEIKLTYQEFQTVDLKDIDVFVNGRSDVLYDSTYLKKDQLPPRIDSLLFNAAIGTSVAPYLENDTYYLARLVQTQMRPDSVKASHILVMHKDAPSVAQQQQSGVSRTRQQAKASCDSMLTILRKDPTAFASLALQKSEYQTAKQDTGNLNWFVDGDLNMKFFYDSCLVMKKGDMRIIESNLGYHILYFQNATPAVKKVKIANIVREIKPGSQTFNNYFTQASEFVGQARDKASFESTLATKGLNKRSAQRVQKLQYTLPGLDISREIIRWAFDEKTEVGAVSEQVFDAQGKYVVAVLVNRYEKGILPLEQVKPMIESLVKREKKAEKIMANVTTALSTTKDLYALATKLNSTVDTMNNLTFANTNLPMFGPEPEVIGALFAAKPKVVTGPLKGNMAVYVAQIDNLIEAPATQDYRMIQGQMMSLFSQRLDMSSIPSNQRPRFFDAYDALRDKTEIMDNRIFFY